MTFRFPTPHASLLACGAAALLAGGARADVDLMTNGGFESALAGWTSVNQVGSSGTFQIQTGITSPVNGFAVPAPPQGVRAAMTDSVGPGTHVLYQDFVVPAVVPGATLKFSWTIRNGATAYSIPTTPSLDFSTPALNQQARIDIITTSADPLSVAAADVLQNVFQTTTSTPLSAGYSVVFVDVTSLLAPRAGQTLRLRIAETDNVNFLSFGVDDVSLTIPAPATTLALAPVVLCVLRRRRRVA